MKHIHMYIFVSYVSRTLIWCILDLVFEKLKIQSKFENVQKGILRKNFIFEHCLYMDENLYVDILEGAKNNSDIKIDVFLLV